MVINNEITLDISKQTQFVKISLPQGDNIDRVFKINLVNGVDEYIIPTTATVRFEMTRPNGGFIYNNCPVESNQVNLEITPPISAIDGRFPAQFRITDSSTGGLIKSFRFHILIHESVDIENAVVNTSEFTALQDMELRVGDIAPAIQAAETATDNANNAADSANDIADQLEAETLIIWKPYVSTYVDITTTYPTPELGWTTQAQDTGIRWRYNGTAWINIGVSTDDKVGDLSTATTTNKTNVVGAINELDSQLADIAYNVMSYGAKGDGIADDTIAINTAIQSIPDGETLLINGKFYITDTILVNRHINIKHKGYIIYGGTRDKSAVKLDNLTECKITFGTILDVDAFNGVREWYDGYYEWVSDNYIGVHELDTWSTEIKIENIYAFTVGYKCESASDRGCTLNFHEFKRLWNNRIGLHFANTNVNSWQTANVFKNCFFRHYGEFASSELPKYFIKQESVAETRPCSTISFYDFMFEMDNVGTLGGANIMIDIQNAKAWKFYNTYVENQVPSYWKFIKIGSSVVNQGIEFVGTRYILNGSLDLSEAKSSLPFIGNFTENITPLEFKNKRVLDKEKFRRIPHLTYNETYNYCTIKGAMKSATGVYNIKYPDYLDYSGLIDIASPYSFDNFPLSCSVICIENLSKYDSVKIKAKKLIANVNSIAGYYLRIFKADGTPATFLEGTTRALLGNVYDTNTNSNLIGQDISGDQVVFTVNSDIVKTVLIFIRGTINDDIVVETTNSGNYVGTYPFTKYLNYEDKYVSTAIPTITANIPYGTKVYDLANYGKYWILENETVDTVTTLKWIYR